MTPLVDLATRLFPFDYSFTGVGNDASAAILNAELPFQMIEYASGRELNGWTIPPACIVDNAELRFQGKVVYDGKAQPLGVPALSDSFVGRITREQLKARLFTVPANSSAVPYHWMRLYRPNDPIWGFCMPQSIAETLPDGDYDVDLRTRLVPSTMKVFLHELTGETEEVILFNAHNCHPFQANDDISGIVVGIELMRRLACLPRRRYSYALMVAPELFGPMFWLDGLAADKWGKIKGAVMLKSVGNDRPLRLQQSFHGNAALDLAAHNIFRQRYSNYESGEFRAIYGNDETVFEAPPYSIPSISVTRWPFPEYHTDQDVPACLHEPRLQETVQTVLGICEALEMNLRPLTTVKGLVCLSRYGLYKPVPPIGADGVDYTSLSGRWNRLMNALPRLMDGRTSLIEIAERFQLPIAEVHSYIQKWISHGLASHN
jgi:aminopeptidase-like protein